MSNSYSIANSKVVLCHYHNSTRQIQIARISNIQNWYFERVVSPGQHLLFEAPQKAYLEIHTSTMATAVLSDRIACQGLQINGDNTTKSFEIIYPTLDEPEPSRELVEL